MTCSPLLSYGGYGGNYDIIVNYIYICFQFFNKILLKCGSKDLGYWSLNANKTVLVHFNTLFPFSADICIYPGKPPQDVSCSILDNKRTQP